MPSHIGRKVAVAFGAAGLTALALIGGDDTDLVEDKKRLGPMWDSIATSARDWGEFDYIEYFRVAVVDTPTVQDGYDPMAAYILEVFSDSTMRNQVDLSRQEWPKSLGIRVGQTGRKVTPMYTGPGGTHEVGDPQYVLDSAPNSP